MPLFIKLIDFKKAFDSIHRATLWKIERVYGVPEKIVIMIKIIDTIMYIFSIEYRLILTC